MIRNAYSLVFIENLDNKQELKPSESDLNPGFLTANLKRLNKVTTVALPVTMKIFNIECHLIRSKR